MNRLSRIGALAAILTITSACVTDKLVQTMQADLGRLRHELTTQGKRLDQLTIQSGENRQAMVTLADRLKHVQDGHADLSLRLNQLAADTRTVKGQADTTDRSIERLQATVKESGDRLSRVEFSTAQAAMMAQEASSLSQTTARSATAALQSMAQQVNAALADLETRIGTPPTQGAKGKNEPGRATRERVTTPQPDTERPQAQAPPTTPTAPKRSPSTNATSEPTPPGAVVNTLRTIVPRQTTAAATTTSNTPHNSDNDYQLALTAFNEQRYPDAIATFINFLREAPDSTLAPLALYWLGETYYAQQQYAEASDTFRRFLERQPSGAKAPAALLKLALIAQATGSPAEAKNHFNAITTQFPRSHEANIAKTLTSQPPK